MEEIDARMADIDEKDIDLLSYVEQNFDANLEQIAKEIDLSKSAVHYRLNKLQDNGIIHSISAEVDPLAFGLNMMAVTDVFVAHESGYADNIGEQLAEIDGVQQVYYTMGDVDFVVISRTQNREQMNDVIDDIVSIDGVNETSSRFVMRELKTDGKVVPNTSEEMRENVVHHDD